MHVQKKVLQRCLRQCLINNSKVQAGGLGRQDYDRQQRTYNKEKEAACMWETERVIGAEGDVGFRG